MTRGGSYSNTLTPDDGFGFVRNGPSLGGFNVGDQEQTGDQGSTGGMSESEATVALICTVSMGGENVTTAAFDHTTGEILIEEVTGRVVVTVETDRP